MFHIQGYFLDIMDKSLDFSISPLCSLGTAPSVKALNPASSCPIGSFGATNKIQVALENIPIGKLKATQ